ncbi:MAG: hypothetical protein WAW52_14640 [Methanothrix sp.]
MGELNITPYLYNAYGLNIYSEFPLSEFAGGCGRPDAFIRKGKIYAMPPRDAFCADTSWTTGKEAYRFVANAGAFLIREGKEIIVDPVSEADENYICRILLGLGLSILLHQRGFLVLHGSAISLKSRAKVFLGPSGSGKSTIVAALCDRYPLVADDLVAIKASAGDIKVYPAISNLKLFPDSALSTGYDLSALPKISPEEEKRVAQPKGGCCIEPLPLGTIYFLKEGEKLQITSFRKKESMMELVRSTFSIGALRAGVNATQHFMQCAIIAKEIPMYQLIRPHDITKLAESIAAVEEESTIAAMN